MIDNIIVEQVISAANIVEVLRDFIAVKKRGSNYVGICPFHNEKTPSLMISPAKGIYKCFGCGAAGNSVKFIMDHEHLSFPDAIKYLAKKYNIEIHEKEQTEEDVIIRNARESVFLANSFAQKYYSNILRNNEDGKAIGLSYFYERGLTDKTIDTFQLGFSLNSFDAFMNNAVKSGFVTEILEQAGLISRSENGNKYFDRFNDRVMFPIHSISGQVLGFGARTLKKDKNIAKYLNTKETTVYNKSAVLYGLYFAKKDIVKQKKCYLVEGYLDVISMHQVGIENVVASSGTALTSDQIRLIHRFTENITLLYDGDQAGIKASLRGINMILEEGMNVKVVLFPDGEDPDSYSHKVSSSEFNDFLVKNENDFIIFKTNLLLKDAKNDPVKKAELVNDILESISFISNNVLVSTYLRECSRLLDIEEQVLIRETNKIKKQRKSNVDKTKSNINEHIPIEEIKEKNANNNSTIETYTISKKSKFEVEETEIIRLLVTYPDKIIFEHTDQITKEVFLTPVCVYIISELNEFGVVFENPLLKKIIDETKLSLSQNIVPEAKFYCNHKIYEISQLSASLQTSKYHLSKLFEKGGVLIETEEMKLKDLVPKIILEYFSKVIIEKLNDISVQLTNFESTSDESQLEIFENQIMFLNEQKKHLAQKLGSRAIV